MAVFRVRTCKTVTALPLGCLLYFLRSQSQWIWTEFSKKETIEGEGKVMLRWKVFVAELITVWLTLATSNVWQIWLQNESLAGLKGKGRC